MNPLILAEYASPPQSDDVGCGSTPPTSSHDTFLRMIGTIFASRPAQGAIACVLCATRLCENLPRDR